MPSPVQSNCDAHDTIANGQSTVLSGQWDTQQVCVRIALLPSNVWQQFFGRSAFLRQQETDLPPAELWGGGAIKIMIENWVASSDSLRTTALVNFFRFRNRGATFSIFIRGGTTARAVARTDLSHGEESLHSKKHVDEKALWGGKKKLKIRWSMKDLPPPLPRVGLCVHPKSESRAHETFSSNNGIQRLKIVIVQDISHIFS
ncbi:hypothetical protein TNCV_1618291 [Trichonephila clavipes]|nr:hypothetical protein TNCV_1618291 [Trichonephila clavipes]